jgi:hypothetical protein
MSKELWVPARPNIDSHDSDPETSVEQKLEAIKRKQGIRIVPDRTRGNPDGFKDLYKAHLPYTKGVSFFLREGSSDIELWDLDLGDKALYGHGIGTRLLQRVVEYGVHKRPDFRTISRGVGNWALVMTLGKVLGSNDFVEFEKGGRKYGALGGHPPIEAVFGHSPVEDGEEYNVKNIVGHIYADRLLSAKAAVEGITTTVE